MTLKVVAKVFGSLIPAMIGTYLLVKDYIAAANHPECSVSPMVMWVKFGVGLIVSIILLFAVFRQLFLDKRIKQFLCPLIWVCSNKIFDLDGEETYICHSRNCC